MRVLKGIGFLLLVLAGLYVIALKFSAVESRFECAGGYLADQQEIPGTLFVRIAEYRWWVGFWSESDASLWLEIPNEAVDYFPKIREVGDQLQILGSNNAIQGNFSTLSKAISLSTPKGFFTGICRKLDA